MTIWKKFQKLFPSLNLVFLRNYYLCYNLVWELGSNGNLTRAKIYEKKKISKIKIKNRTKVLREERNVASMFTGLIHQSTKLKTLFESAIAERLEALIRVTKGFLSRSNGNRFFFFDGIFEDCECDAVRRVLYTG